MARNEVGLEPEDALMSDGGLSASTFLVDDGLSFVVGGVFFTDFGVGVLLVGYGSARGPDWRRAAFGIVNISSLCQYNSSIFVVNLD